MESKDTTFYPLIVLFFALGLIIGYVIHKPETIEKVEYINNTIEKIVVVTPAQTTISSPAITSTPLPDFTVKSLYDPSRDRPFHTIELVNWRATPDELRVRPGESVLIKISDYTLQSSLTLILNSSHEENLGTSGARMIIFNNKGQYSFDAIIRSPDPSILPRTYAKGIITVS